MQQRRLTFIVVTALTSNRFNANDIQVVLDIKVCTTTYANPTPLLRGRTSMIATNSLIEVSRTKTVVTGFTQPNNFVNREGIGSVLMSLINLTVCQLFQQTWVIVGYETKDFKTTQTQGSEC